MSLCINKHANIDNARECTTCHLPIIDYREEIDKLKQLLSKKSVFARPKVATVYYGIGGHGCATVRQLQNLTPTSPRISFCYLDSSTEDLSRISEGNSSIITYSVGSINTGSAVFCGLGEMAAARDDGLVDQLYRSGCREPDENQILFFVSALGGGTGSGLGPQIVAACKRINSKSTTIAISVLPSANEPPQAHFNAYYGVSKLLAVDNIPLTEMLVLLDHDRLRQTRGVGKGGSELKMESIVTAFLKLLGVTFTHTSLIPISKTLTGLGIQAVIPCLAMGRSVNIFGSLTNVLDSALVVPLAPLEPSRVTFSCLLLSIPQRLGHMFPANGVSQEFQGWNVKHFPGLRASEFQIAQTEELSDRVDCCILLGGNSLDSTMNKAIKGFESFKGFCDASMEVGQWANCGLSPEKVKLAEETVRQYDFRLSIGS
ncbi:MAG: hypothetical protein Q8P44_06970 [Dehalococcoidia bacterium]|nr:hypothetical protein [Dehalococcoidia bacterium]